jgi:hypothetical protein
VESEYQDDSSDRRQKIDMPNYHEGKNEKRHSCPPSSREADDGLRSIFICQSNYPNTNMFKLISAHSRVKPGAFIFNHQH